MRHQWAVEDCESCGVRVDGVECVTQVSEEGVAPSLESILDEGV